MSGERGDGGGGGGHEQLAAAAVARGPAVAAHRVPVLVLRPGVRLRTQAPADHALAPAPALRTACAHNVHTCTTPRSHQCKHEVLQPFPKGYFI